MMREASVEMSSTRIRTRTTQRGQRRYMVCYRLGGRYSQERSAGTFDKLTHARQRLTAVQGLITAATTTPSPTSPTPPSPSWLAPHGESCTNVGWTGPTT